ncbi:uncharacterized protein LOC135816230 isoform X2 [Sycon ciliatum]|uniref:uncharacterized protein LOC135816230 isoform X2 n=1 Tax=Sycon ciliatum TaxID=27933 RepID=UPI0031F61F2F
MLRVTSGSANGQQRWRLDASAKVLIQLLLYVLYAGRCTAQQQNVNTWVDCGDEGEVFITNTTKPWEAGEKFCQTLGSHLASSPQLTACNSIIVRALRNTAVSGNVAVQTSYTKLLDILHFRDTANNLEVSDSLITFNLGIYQCSVQVFGQVLQLAGSSCTVQYPVVCGRNTNTQAASIVCDSHMYTYHSISFSADHANQTCYEQYSGWLLPTDMRQLRCVSHLLNSSQVLGDNSVTTIPLYTSGRDESANCLVYNAWSDKVLGDSCTAARPTICVSRYCNSSDNLVAVPNEDRCVCKRGYISNRTTAHKCESIVELFRSTGQAGQSSNITVFIWLKSEWRVHSVYTQNTLHQLANFSLPEGRLAIRSAERIIYTSPRQADTVAAELAKNHSQFFIVNASTSNILLPSAHLRNYLVNLSVWFRPYKVECVNIPSTNQSDTCSYSVFNESVPFKDGLYEFALSPHNSTLLSIPVLYTVYPRPTTTVPRMTSMPGNNASSSSDGMPSVVSSSPSGTVVTQKPAWLVCTLALVVQCYWQHLFS